ncbi:MAG TPA: MAPEG family protein [Steroidobacteraceae bacterium]|nr:MAPEG family protein [Steroidobacteraceae bacterium]
MSVVYLVMGLALIQYQYFGFQVGRARTRFGVKAPAVTGNEPFERYFRVQQNTLELIVVLVPALPLFAYYVSARWAAGLGAVYLIGRIVYSIGYIKDPAKRGPGFGLSFLPIVLLLLGGIVGAARAVFTG